MRIKVGELRQVIKETMEQLGLPGVDTEHMSSGDEERDLQALQNKLEKLRARNKAEMPIRTRQNKDEFDMRRAAERELQQKINVLHRKLNPTKYDLLSPAEKQRWAIYGGDPNKRPGGLGS